MDARLSRHRAVSGVRPPSMFFAEIGRLMYTPVNPSFTVSEGCSQEVHIAWSC